MGAGRWLWRFGGEVVAARVARGRVPWREEDAPSRARKMLPNVRYPRSNQLSPAQLKSTQPNSPGPLNVGSTNPTNSINQILFFRVLKLGY